MTAFYDFFSRFGWQIAYYVMDDNVGNICSARPQNVPIQVYNPLGYGPGSQEINIAKCRLSLMESREKFSPFTCGLKLNTMHSYAFELFGPELKTVALIQFAWCRQFVLHLIGYRIYMRQYARKMSIKSVVTAPTQTALVHVFQWNGIAKKFLTIRLSVLLFVLIKSLLELKL